MVTLSLFAVPAWCWNFAVHATIGELAWQHLPPAQQQDYDRSAEALLMKLEPYISKKTERFYLLSPFARTAILFDEWRMWHLGTVFKKYGAPIPEALQPMQDTEIRSLHFANIPWPDNGPLCGEKSTSEKQRINNWFTRLKAAQKEAADPVAKGIVHAILAHVTGDFHEPLHAIMEAKRGCAPGAITDGGGTTFCVSPHYREDGDRIHCASSLHAFWDAAGGVVRSSTHADRMPGIVEKLKKDYPFESLKGCSDLNPITWLNEDYALSEFIFSTPEFQHPHQGYIEKSKEIGSQRIVEASCRLLQML